MLNNGDFTFFCRTKTSFGMNALEHLPFDLAGMGSQKPLVLLDKNALLGSTKPLIRAFKESEMTLGICPPIEQTSDTGGNSGQSDIEILKEFYQIYTDKGFDAIIALGTGRVADMAKALNIAVTLGPETLKATLKETLETNRATNRETPLTQPLSPFVYIPTGMGTGMETHSLVRFNGNTFASPFLAPDLAIIDPDILTDPIILTDPVILDPNTLKMDAEAPLINASLTCLSVCCEAHVLSGNPVARAYAATGIALIMENFLPLVKQIYVPTPPKRSDKKAMRKHLACLTHASVITGILLANCTTTSFQLGKRIAEHTGISPGQAMAILLPAVLDLMANDRSDLGNLFKPLAGSEDFSRVPPSQRPGLSIQKIQCLLNELYQISLGTIPRTLDDAGLDPAAMKVWVQTTLSDPALPGSQIPGIDPKKIQAILAWRRP